MEINIVQEKCKQYLDDLLDLIPDYCHEMFKQQTFIAGGCIRSLIVGETPSDIDIFIKTEANAPFLGILELGFRSENAISFTHKNMKYQIIINSFGTPDEIVNEFDFTCNMNYYDGSLQVKHQYDIDNKQLRINPKCRNILGTLGRIPKFIEKGFKCPPKEDMVMLGVKLTRQTPINTGTEIIAASRMYFNESEYESVCFLSGTTLVPYAETPLFRGSSI